MFFGSRREGVGLAIIGFGAFFQKKVHFLSAILQCVTKNFRLADWLANPNQYHLIFFFLLLPASLRTMENWTLKIESFGLTAAAGTRRMKIENWKLKESRDRLVKLKKTKTKSLTLKSKTT